MQSFGIGWAAFDEVVNKRFDPYGPLFYSLVRRLLGFGDSLCNNVPECTLRLSGILPTLRRLQLVREFGTCLFSGDDTARGAGES